MPAQTREPALVDDGIPGGPGVYSTRCPPLPRLRLTESREVVRRAALRAKGVDPDLVEHNFRPLRSYPLPLWFKRWFVVAAMR